MDYLTNLGSGVFGSVFGGLMTAFGLQSRIKRLEKDTVSRETFRVFKNGLDAAIENLSLEQRRVADKIDRLYELIVEGKK